MNRTFKLFSVCLCCFTLTLLSGCGNPHTPGVPRTTSTQSASGIPAPVPVPVLTPVEQVEADRYIAEHGRKAIVHCLIDMKQDNEKLILRYLQYLVSQGADVNTLVIREPPYDEELTPLFLAVSQRDIEIIKFLVSQGANVNMKGSNGWSPLHSAVSRFLYAKSHQNIEIVKFLVSKGADVNAKNQFDSTPLDMAKSSLEGANRPYQEGSFTRSRIIPPDEMERLKEIIAFLSSQK